MAGLNYGFRGSIISISEIKVEGRGSAGTVVKYRVLFSDGEGLTHATTTHEVEVGEDSLFHEPVRQLLEACRRHSENLHFTSPSTPTLKEAISRGIAEAASGLPDTTDEPGEAG